jgi:kynurenine formamidase
MGFWLGSCSATLLLGPLYDIVCNLHSGTHNGTHRDAASRFVPQDKAIVQYALERFLMPGIVVPVHVHDDDEPIGVNAFETSLSIPSTWLAADSYQLGSVLEY